MTKFIPIIAENFTPSHHPDAAVRTAVASGVASGVSHDVSSAVSGDRHNTAGEGKLTALPPLSLYVHVPWCVRKCPYCDFNSHQTPATLPEDLYLDALQADLEQALPSIWGRQVFTVFIGGGTPSLLSDRGIDRMLAMLRSHLSLWPDAEITLEANPGTAEASRFKSYAASGVNRISLGVQSFDDAALRVLGRIHDADQARAAIEMAQRAVKRVNLDLMFALPGQTLEQSIHDAKTALSFGTEHLSMYHLTLEPNTVLSKYPPFCLRMIWQQRWRKISRHSQQVRVCCVTKFLRLQNLVQYPVTIPITGNLGLSWNWPWCTWQDFLSRSY